MSARSQDVLFAHGIGQKKASGPPVSDAYSMTNFSTVRNTSTNIFTPDGIMASSKTFTVLANTADSNTGAVELYVMDKKSGVYSLIWSGVPAASRYLHYNYARGIILSDRYFFYVAHSDSYGRNTFVKDLVSGITTQTQTAIPGEWGGYDYGQWAHPTNGTGYAGSYGNIYKFNTAGTLLWTNTYAQSNYGNYYIYGEYNGFLYVHLRTGMIHVINASTGTTLGTYSVSTANDPSGFISTDGHIISWGEQNNNRTYVYKINADGSINTTAITYILNYAAKPVPLNKEGTVIGAGTRYGVSGSPGTYVHAYNHTNLTTPVKYNIAGMVPDGRFHEVSLPERRIVCSQGMLANQYAGGNAWECYVNGKW